MATHQGMYYYTKEEIDELLVSGLTVDDFTFTFERSGYSSETLTGKRIKLANGLYAYCFHGQSTINVTSTGNKGYFITWDTPFDVIYGASLNGAFVGQSDCNLNHVNFLNRGVDFYIKSTGTTGKPLINFIVIGKPHEEEGSE